MTRSILTKKIASNAMVAAIYFVLCIVSGPFAYGDIQVRIAEMMILLCFFRRDFVIGVTLGCLLANFNSTLGMWDVLIGTFATLASSLLVAYASPRLLVACIYPIAFNGFIVAGELYWLCDVPYWYSVGTVSLGETIAIMLGYLVLMLLKKRKSFFQALECDRHLDFTW